MSKIEIFTDGSCIGNPGPGGLGAILRYNGKSKEIFQGFRHTTNNRMELLAVIVSLESLKTNEIPVKVYSDSRYVVNSISKKWIFNWQKTDFKGKKNADLWKRYLAIHSNFKIEFQWVKGHNGHAENERCDSLALKGSSMENPGIDHGYEFENPLMT